MTYSLEDAKKLINLARAAIENKAINIEGFEDKRGVFITLNSWPDKMLRGCIGFPEPTKPLKEAIVEAAKAAAYNDARFKPLNKDEKFIIEISILTIREEIKVHDPQQCLEQISIGQDGLIVDMNGQKGLLLPQVFPEWNADPLRALEMTCEKAGLQANCWHNKDCRLYKFQAQVFKEESPNGNVVER